MPWPGPPKPSNGAQVPSSAVIPPWPSTAFGPDRLAVGAPAVERDVAEPRVERHVGRHRLARRGATP